MSEDTTIRGTVKKYMSDRKEKDILSANGIKRIELYLAALLLAGGGTMGGTQLLKANVKSNVSKIYDYRITQNVDHINDNKETLRIVQSEMVNKEYLEEKFRNQDERHNNVKEDITELKEQVSDIEGDVESLDRKIDNYQDTLIREIRSIR